MTRNPDALVGRTVGPFTLDRLLGQGGFAWVYEARRAATGEPVAVKVLKPRYGTDEQFERRFRNEFTVASELSHPRIVRIHEVGNDAGVTFFAMDLYQDSLGRLIERGGPVPEARLVTIVMDVLEGLAAAHAAGIVHRDIKVDNIMLGQDGRAVIADFGIARAVSGYVSATGVNMTIGTPGYVSPEQAQGRPLDGRSDLYAVGVTLYKAVTGELPFKSQDWFELARMHVEDPPVPPRVLRPECSGALERVILRCLAKHPDDRYASAQALLEELRALQAGDRRTTDVPLPARRPSRLRETLRGAIGHPLPRWAMLLAAVLVIAVVAFAVVWLGKR